MKGCNLHSSRARRLLGGAALAACALASSPARADQPLVWRAARIDAIGRSAASEDGAEALRLNPANLGYLPAWEVRYDGVRCTDTTKINCGHALEAATPLVFGLSSGVRVDYELPPDTADLLYRNTTFTWLTWGLAYKLDEQLSFGASLQGAFSTSAVTNGLFGLTVGASYRPDPHVGFSLVAQDLNQSAQPFPGGQVVLDRSFVGAVAFRPAGKRNVELDFDMTYREGSGAEDSDLWLPRVTLGVDIPGVGRARGDLAIAHLENDAKRGVVATAGLEIALSHYTAGGGALFGSGLGGSNVGEYGTASVAGYDQPGLPIPARAVGIRIESTPGTRGHVALLRKLWALSEDPTVAAVVMSLRTSPVTSWAHAEELADAFRVLRARGKKVICSLEDNGAPSIYVCANADRVVINPAGGVRYAGLKATYIYLAGLLDKLGIKAEFVRIGAHKTAPEQLTNEHASPVAVADHQDMLANAEAVFVKNLANGRHLTEEHVREVTRKGPFVAQEAKDAGLVDGFAFDDELERVAGEVVGRKVSLEQYSEVTRAPEKFGAQSKVALLYIDGDMVDGRSQTIPLLDIKLCGSYTIAETIRHLREDGSVKAVVVRIESPGGSSMAADVMWRELRLLAEKKPMVVSMGGVAASGGYYVAAAAKEIYALPLTVTGSIGIFYGKADISGLMKKIGVTTDTYKTTPRADAESLFRPFTADEKAELQRKVGQFYDMFLDRVATGRHMTKAQVDAVGQGRVWAGQEAIEHHLVDRLAGLREALDEARTLANLPKDAPIVEEPVIEQSLVQKVLGLGGEDRMAQALVTAGLPVQIKNAVRAIAPMAVYTPDVPMARMEWVPIDGSD